MSQVILFFFFKIISLNIQLTSTFMAMRVDLRVGGGAAVVRLFDRGMSSTRSTFSTTFSCSDEVTSGFFSTKTSASRTLASASSLSFDSFTLTISTALSTFSILGSAFSFRTVLRPGVRLRLRLLLRLVDLRLLLVTRGVLRVSPVGMLSTFLTCFSSSVYVVPSSNLTSYVLFSESISTTVALKYKPPLPGHRPNTDSPSLKAFFFPSN